MQVDWSVFKVALDSGNLTLKEIIVGPNYWLKAFDSSFAIDCLIPVDSEHPDTADYVANYQSQANSPIKSKVVTEPANLSVTLYRATDIAEVAAGEEATIDLSLIAADVETHQILYGGALYADEPGFGDYVRFQVVHPLGSVLKQYIDKAYLSHGGKFEDYDEVGAALPVGLILRCIYKSTKATGSTKVKINYLLGVP